MKSLLKYLIIYTITVISLTNDRALSRPDFWISMPEIGPFMEYSPDSKINFDITCNKKHDSVYERLEVVDNFTNRRVIFTAHTKTHSPLIHEQYSISLLLPTSELLNKYGMFCIISVLAPDGSYSLPVEFFLYPKESKTFDLNKNKNTVVDLRETRFSIRNNLSRPSHESFTFYEDYDYFLIDQYYRLSIDQFKFKAELLNETYESAYLVLRNPKPCFYSLFNGETTNEIKIPLSLEKGTNDEFSLSFARILYVDPNTNMMSQNPKTGYVATHYFYCPLNKKDEFIDQEFYFEINGIGESKTNLFWSAFYMNNVNFIGDCSDSEYCVVGGQR